MVTDALSKDNAKRLLSSLKEEVAFSQELKLNFSIPKLMTTDSQQHGRQWNQRLPTLLLSRKEMANLTETANNTPSSLSISEGLLPTQQARAQEHLSTIEHVESYWCTTLKLMVRRLPQQTSWTQDKQTTCLHSETYSLRNVSGFYTIEPSTSPLQDRGKMKEQSTCSHTAKQECPSKLTRPSIHL